MLFNSFEFLIFFPAVLLVYLFLPAKIRYLWLLVSSYYFYMYWNPIYAFIITAAILWTYLCGRLIEGAKRKKGLLTLSLVINIGMLVYFKYSGFALNTVNSIFAALGRPTLEVKFDMIMPIGISFYTFQTTGYLVDIYRGNVKAERNIAKYALFVAFFPQLLSGPIGRAESLLVQIEENSRKKLWNCNRITGGLTLMLWGYFIKLVIADRVAVLVNTVFDHYYLYGMTALMAGAIGFAIQIYGDFAGYSFIAIGAAKVLGFELIENFKAPYFSQSISEFWRRWHVSLSAWLRDYIYIPLGGNRKGKGKKYRNILITFGVSGLWHGANWTFIIWGLLHGMYQVLESEIKPFAARIHAKAGTKTVSVGYRLGKGILTFLMVDFAWIFFKSESISDALSYIMRLVSYRDWWSFFDGSLYTLGLDFQEMHILFFGILVFMVVDYIRLKKEIMIDVFLREQWLVFRWAVIILLFYFTVIFGQYGPGFDSSNFIYLQF